MDTQTMDRPTGVRLRFVEEDLLALMARAAHEASAEFHAALRAAGVAVPVWQVLAALSGVEDETVTGLANACLLQQPTMTKLLDRMVRDGQVGRRSDPRDRRVVRIQLTPRGREMLERLVPLAHRHEAAVLARLPEEDAGRIKALLRALADGDGRGAGRRRARPSPEDGTGAA